MTGSKKAPLAVVAKDMPPREKPSIYPAPFATRVEGREKLVLGEPFGLKNFGVNLTTLKPGAQSALLHRHETQDEFIYVLEGTPHLVTDHGEQELRPGMCAGFPAKGIAHHLVNRSNEDVVYLEIGDRSPNDTATYPNDDIKADLDTDGKWQFSHKDGQPY